MVNIENPEPCQILLSLDILIRVALIRRARLNFFWKKNMEGIAFKKSYHYVHLVSTPIVMASQDRG